MNTLNKPDIKSLIDKYRTEQKATPHQGGGSANAEFTIIHELITSFVGFRDWSGTQFIDISFQDPFRDRDLWIFSFNKPFKSGIYDLSTTSDLLVVTEYFSEPYRKLETGYLCLTVEDQKIVGLLSGSTSTANPVQKIQAHFEVSKT